MASQDSIVALLDTSVLDFCNHNKLSETFMKRLMDINMYNRTETLFMLGANVPLNGDSNSLSGIAPAYSYAYGTNYVTNYAVFAERDEQKGVNSTRQRKKGGSDDPYPDVENLYPDERGYGKFDNKWNLNGEQNSILYKMRKLFRDRKINTIISSFGTKTEAGNNLPEGLGDSTTDYGMSHGRNLLRVEVEKRKEDGFYTVNGYKNPYCRVWTHHSAMDRVKHLIRPFTLDTLDSGNFVVSEERKLSKIHDWQWDEVSYGWKGGKGADRWEKSVLNSNGFVNITPKHDIVGSVNRNIHTRNCMFSIENLAWKGYDPYQFEKALSWEQRGPFGGRIMWFPPYGLTFNETTSVKWEGSSFIGRGEDVYTYANTQRSGTLSFIMLTDHPSVTDYATWWDNESDIYGNVNENNLSDTDLLRFFAGCDPMAAKEPDSILNKVRPTPMTDEFYKTEEGYKDEEELRMEPNKEPVAVPEEEKEFQFYVFFPNNYSGQYDKPVYSMSSVHSIAYLLGGEGCQKQNNGTQDIPLGILFGGFNGTGYEMQDAINQGGSGNYIVGSTIHWADYKKKGLKEYKKQESKKWYYRIDGEYKVPSNDKETYSNTYDQTLLDSDGKVTYENNTNYRDTQCYGLNRSADEVKKRGAASEADDNLYSFAEVVAAVYRATKNGFKGFNSNISDKLINKYDLDEERITNLVDHFDNYEITKISIDGRSNSHGSTSTLGYKRNKRLALGRAETIKQWFKECGVPVDLTSATMDQDENNIGVDVNKGDENNVSALSAKINRCARVTITFKYAAIEPLTETAGENNPNQWHKYTGFTLLKTDSETGNRIYKDARGVEWTEIEEGRLVVRKHGRYYIDKDGNKIWTDEEKAERGEDKNQLRYDQEYYFFKRMELESPLIMETLRKKLRYFDPAFHSMTPEGFNQRLTFLQQCTRQGNTITPSDNGMKTASNLAFGRPPFCVLRIGDFYYQTIVIDSINIDYNVSGGLQWDLNPEGAGVQPMLAQVNISFKFIGGGDLGGPIRRLQNAMTFNYYANASLYDNRADRGDGELDDKTQIRKNNEGSYAYTPAMAK